MAILSNLAVAITASTKKFREEMAKARGSAMSFTGTMKNMARQVSAARTAFSMVFTGMFMSQMSAFARQIGQAAEGLEKTGVAATALQKAIVGMDTARMKDLASAAESMAVSWEKAKVGMLTAGNNLMARAGVSLSRGVELGVNALFGDVGSFGKAAQRMAVEEHRAALGIEDPAAAMAAAEAARAAKAKKYFEEHFTEGGEFKTTVEARELRRQGEVARAWDQLRIAREAEEEKAAVEAERREFVREGERLRMVEETRLEKEKAEELAALDKRLWDNMWKRVEADMEESNKVATEIQGQFQQFDPGRISATHGATLGTEQKVRDPAVVSKLDDVIQAIRNQRMVHAVAG